MKVFLSWSGDRSKALANALKVWLPLVLHYVEPWVSESDIDAGARWGEAVAKQLDGCNFGILCITKENVNAPWILFEAGALAKMLDGSRLIPLLLDVDFSDITGPLAQFQGKKLDSNGMLEVVSSINTMSPTKVPEDRYSQLFNVLYQQLEQKVDQIPKTANLAKHSRSQAEVLEELVTTVRAVETRMRDGIDEPPNRIRSRKMMHPEFLYEMMHTVGDEEGDPMLLLMLAGLYREEYPWLSEILTESYRKFSDGHIDASRLLLEKFMVGLKLSRRLGPRGDLLLREQDFFFEKFLPQLLRKFETPAAFGKYRMASGKKQ